MIAFDIPDIIKTRQCRDLLQALQQGPVDTLTARERLGIAHPAGRILDLRKAGFPIETRKAWAEDTEGRRHLVGVYRLRETSHAE